MLRIYQKLKNEVVKVGRLAQVVNNKITTRFPLLKKGIDVKPTINTSYETGRSTLCSIGESKVIVAVDNALHLSKYEDSVFTELSTIVLSDASTIQKIIKLDNNRVVAICNSASGVACYLIDVNTSTNTMETINRLVVTSTNSGNPRIDAKLINKNKLAIAYHEKWNMFYSYPCFVVVRIEDSGFKMLQQPVKIDEQIDAFSIVSITKVNDSTFLGTYATTHTRETTAHSLIYEVSSADVLTKVSTLEYRGYYNAGDYYIEPFYLADNKIVLFEFVSDFDMNIVIREANKEMSTGSFTFHAISTIKGNHKGTHNFDLLRQNEDGSRDYVALNTQVIRVDKANSKLTKVDEFDRFTRVPLDIEFHKIPTTKLADNLMLYTDEENNFKVYSYIEKNGSVLGIVTAGDKDGYSIKMTGLVEDVADVSFEAGKKVYCGDDGKLTHNSSENLLGYAISNNSFIMRPELVSQPVTIIEGTGGYLHNNKNYLHGFIPYVNESIENNKPYYLDSTGNLTETLTDKKIGIGLGKGLYIKREEALAQTEINKRDLAKVQKILAKIDIGGEIEEDITLPTLSTEGINLTYASSNTAYLSEDGKVTKPTSTIGNQAVTLTANITKGNVSAAKDFDFIVLAEVPAEDDFTIEITGRDVINFETTQTYKATVKKNGIQDDTQTVTFTLNDIYSIQARLTIVDGSSCTVTSTNFREGTLDLVATLDNNPTVSTTKALRVGW